MRDSRGRDTSGLFALDLATGKPMPIGGSAKADVAGVIAHPTTGEIEAYGVNYLKKEWVPVAASVKDDIAFLNREAKGEWSVVSQTRDNRKWTLQVDRVSEPVTFYLYDRDAKKLSRLFTARPELEGRALAPMGTFEIKSARRPRAGGLPDAAARQRSQRRRQARAGRCRWCCSSTAGRGRATTTASTRMHQWLANRGYAVLSVNYRGSTGFGKKFINAGDLRVGRQDARRPARRGRLGGRRRASRRRDKVAIMGGSYGGYATLVGLTFTPDAFACGVDIVGPSNLVTLLETIPAVLGAVHRARWYARVGDPRTEAGRKVLLDALAAHARRRDPAGRC